MLSRKEQKPATQGALKRAEVDLGRQSRSEINNLVAEPASANRASWDKLFREFEYFKANEFKFVRSRDQRLQT